MLTVAACLLVLCALVHSVLGEHYILRPLCRRDNLPKLLGGDSFTKGTLRFAWHITSFAWLGFAALLLLWPVTAAEILYSISLVFILSGVFSAYYTKGKHLSWLVFFAVALLCIASVPAA